MPNNSVAVGESPAKFQPAISAWNNMSQSLSDLVQKYYKRETYDKSPLEQMKDLLGWNKVLQFYREQDRAYDPNAQMQDTLRAQINEDLAGPSKDLQNRFLTTGLMTSLGTGNRIDPLAYSGNSSGKAILQNIFGNNYENFRTQQQQKAAQFLQDNPVQENIPTAADVINYQTARDQDKINARNEKMGVMLNQGEKNVADTGNMIQNMMAAIQQYGNNVANASNASNAGKNSTLGGLLSGGASVGSAAIMAF